MANSYGSFEAGPVTQYDYTNQAWVVDGHYVTCGHRDACRCFGRLHVGEPVREDAEAH